MTDGRLAAPLADLKVALKVAVLVDDLDEQLVG